MAIRIFAVLMSLMLHLIAVSISVWSVPSDLPDVDRLMPTSEDGAAR